MFYTQGLRLRGRSTATRRVGRGIAAFLAPSSASQLPSVLPLHNSTLRTAKTRMKPSSSWTVRILMGTGYPWRLARVSASRDVCASYVPRVFRYSIRDVGCILPKLRAISSFTRCSAAIAFHHGFTCTSHVQLSHSRRRKFSGPRRWSSSPPWRRSRSPPQREYRRETTRHSYFEQDQYGRGRGYEASYENSRRYRERSRSPPSQRFGTWRDGVLLSVVHWPKWSCP